MRREVQQDPGKIWWLPVDTRSGRVLAQCAIWPLHDAGRWRWAAGHNYEYGWRTRDERFWPLAHAARQAWIVKHHISQIMTWLHDEDPATGRTADVISRHLRDGWMQVDEGWSPDNPAQFCRQLAWKP